MSSNDPKCKGCLSYQNSGYPCTLPSSHKHKDCPCLTCLVKGVCKDYRNCVLLLRYDTNQES